MNTFKMANGFCAKVGNFRQIWSRWERDEDRRRDRLKPSLNVVAASQQQQCDQVARLCSQFWPFKQ